MPYHREAELLLQSHLRVGDLVMCVRPHAHDQAPHSPYKIASKNDLGIVESIWFDECNRPACCVRVKTGDLLWQDQRWWVFLCDSEGNTNPGDDRARG